MQNKKARYSKWILILLLMIFIIINLIFPYNFVSISKSVGIKPNRDLINNNIELLNSMEQNKNINDQEKVVLEQLNIKFTNQTKKININKNDLEQLSYDLKEMRKIIIKNFSYNNNEDNIYHLNVIIGLIVDLELDIQNIRNRNFEDVWSLKRELKHVQNQLNQILDTYNDLKK